MENRSVVSVVVGASGHDFGEEDKKRSPHYESVAVAKRRRIDPEMIEAAKKGMRAAM